ncbi:fumarylacetoacetate hydrolase family protein [Streptomyces sp. NBC_00878]|uniref:fumarylacetoacetate hydrolase family protein n=1 Tax=Streptomyces sp. NBC_00878 TaxID=2975854 RepID=UPI00225B7CFA|nr:fumarylacetoacetate hydrolase family protein [Streptomyces sp. NBC_00878]MCX4903831.1 fumarylacetoacetate hydrolase family protein [Streptomyces sp. NBC_00878]
MPAPFALGRFRCRVDGTQFCAVVIGDELLAIADLAPGLGADDIDAALDDWPTAVKALQTAVDEHLATGRWAESARRLDTVAPVAPWTPRQLFQSGANYKQHVVELIVAAAAEAGDANPADTQEHAIALMEERAAHGTPYVFLGLPSAVCGPVDDVVLPDTGTQHDWELELGVVIGTEAYRVPRDAAMQHVAGYVIANDLTTRDRVFRPEIPSIGTDWLAGKNAPTFLPLGPYLVPAAFVDPADLRVTLRLNGQVMQDESTADMIFGIAELIEHVSAITPLRPGDLLLTGSPAGNGAHYGRYLSPGDIMEATITGLGTQRNRCVAL